MRSFWVKPSTLFAILVTSLTVFLAGCSAYIPQDILAPASPASREIAGLFYLVFWVAVIVFILVEGLLVFFVLRYQRKQAEEHPEQYHGNTRLEVTWTLIPAVILAVLFAFTIQTMGSVGPTRAPAEGLKVNVSGLQWWWAIEYPDAKVTTASEMHIPQGEVVNVNLHSDNVIHSFWVPRIMGKTDTMPGHNNVTWLYGDELGVFSGQCAEFCGTQHANMRFRVIVQSPSDFQAWLQQQAQPPVEPAAGSIEAAGKALFLNPDKKCIGCHTINGTNALGVTGPNLTHFASRDCFAGCTFERTHENLTRWLTNPQAMLPGNLMVIPQLTEDEVNSLTAYLESLR